jgi:hypothetical protein
MFLGSKVRRVRRADNLTSLLFYFNIDDFSLNRDWLKIPCEELLIYSNVFTCLCGYGRCFDS